MNILEMRMMEKLEKESYKAIVAAKGKPNKKVKVYRASTDSFTSAAQFKKYFSISL